MERISKKILTDNVAERLGMTKGDASLVLDTIVDEIVNQIAAGNEVRLPGFGTFFSRMNAARAAYIPSLGEIRDIPAKRAPKFRPAGAFRSIVQSTQSTTPNITPEA